MQSVQHQQRLLLVGEGNFSFAAGLCKATTGRQTHITATCYESEEAVSKQALAKSNIQRLRDGGAEVRFCVDCTKLKEHFLPSERDFDRIYFNFPHCGRKAGVKQNRELIARFFCSCREVLAEKGEVHVALCKGQGGTPADQPMREWHNSWQVVAVAAEAGFILSHIHPFNTGDSCEYKSTGYRSQDKSFCTEDALTHIFTRSLPLLHPRPPICQTELEGKLVSFVVPEIFADKINRGFLDVNSEHPVRTINSKLIDELGQSFPVQRVSCSLPLVCQARCPASSPEDAFWMVPVVEGNLDLTSAANKMSQDTEAFAFPSDFPEWGYTDQSNNWNLEQYYLRPSLLGSFHRVIQEEMEFLPGTFLVLSGLSFRKCKISPHALPVFHETVFLCVVDKGMEDSCIQLLMENITGTLSSLLQRPGFKFGWTMDESAIAHFGTFVTSELQLHRPKYFITVKHDASDPDPKELHVGTVSTAPWQPASPSQEMVCASLNLDLIAMHVCEIPDWRLLWTFDERFLNQFLGEVLGPFQNFSLYPPSYVHDVSFWVPEAGFDETRFHTIARRVSGETIVSVQLLDSFQCPAAARTSLCYRLTYQSCDRALSRQQAAAMQVMLRQELERCLHVTLR